MAGLNVAAALNKKAMRSEIVSTRRPERAKGGAGLPRSAGLPKLGW
jgi:hypothetical protein